MNGECRIGAGRINEYLDKQTDLQRKGLSYHDAELEKHIQECNCCRREWLEQRRLFAVLAGLKQINPPEDFTVRLMERLPGPVGRPAPSWVMLAGTLIAALSVTLFFTMGYMVLKFIDKLSFFKGIAGAGVMKMVGAALFMLDLLLEAAKLIFSLLEAFAAIAAAYPIPIILTAGTAFFLFVILVKQINSFQRKNFA